MQRVDEFFLLRSEDFVRFHQCVATIVEWAGERLSHVRRALDTIGMLGQEEMEGRNEDQGSEDIEDEINKDNEVSEDKDEDKDEGKEDEDEHRDKDVEDEGKSKGKYYEDPDYKDEGSEDEL